MRRRLSILVPCLLLPYLMGGDWAIQTYQATFTKSQSFDVGGTAAPDSAYSIRLQDSYGYSTTGIIASHGGTVPANGSAWSNDFDPSEDINTTPHTWPVSTENQYLVLIQGEAAMDYKQVDITN